jgi:hypothetical protein
VEIEEKFGHVSYLEEVVVHRDSVSCARQHSLPSSMYNFLDVT